MFQSFAATGYRDLATRIVQLATSGYFENGYNTDTPSGLVVAPGGGGTGYTDGDVLTISHPSGLAPCQFIVGTDGAGHIIIIKQIINGGAFQNRIATVAVNAGGTGYAVDDVLGIIGGLATNPAKVKVTSVSGGAVTGVVLFEDGGSYVTAPPTTACPTTKAIGTGNGTGCTLNLTLQGVLTAPYNAGGVVSGGSGTGAVFNGSLTFAGWTVLRSVNNFSFNSVLDEKEIVLQGSALSGQVPALVGIRTGTNGSGGSLRHFLSFTGFTAFDALSLYNDQPNAINPQPSTTAGQYISVLPAATTIQCWIGGNSRMLRGIVRNDGGSATVYHSYYVGLLDAFGTATENPYPMVVMASHNAIDVAADSISGLTNAADGMISGITECYRDTTVGRSGPCVMWSQKDVAWVEVFNGGDVTGSGPPPWATIGEDRTVWPVGKTKQPATDTKADLIVDDGGWASWNTVCRADGSDPTMFLRPTPDVQGNIQVLFPVLVIDALNGYPVGALNNVYWVSGVKTDGTLIAPEDTFSISGARFRVFRNAARTKAYSYFAMMEGK